MPELCLSTVSFREEERQMALLAFARLSAERPGCDFLLGLMAEKLAGRELYETFKRVAGRGTVS
jgi:hypothetical protein